jgi:TonB family protein
MHGYTGTVQIEFLVSDRGEVSNIVVLNEGAYMSFERAVVRAVREWRYEPLLRNGVPVERRMVETFDFRLRGPDTPSSGPGCKRDKNNRYTCTTPGVNRVL